MKHNLHISVSDKPQRNGMVSYKSITLRERFMRMLFGKKQKIMILVPVTRLRNLPSQKLRKEVDHEQSNRIT